MTGATAGSRHWTAADIGDQSGRVVVVTGANSGLGLEISSRLAEHGAHVVMACRDVAKAGRAAEQLRRDVAQASVEVSELDLADLGSVAAFAQSFTASHDRLDLLINNAGLMAVDHSRTAQGFEMQFGVNHLGHFALTEHLLPTLVRTAGSRVATMASMGHRGGRMRFDDLMRKRKYNRWLAYTQSKLANILFTSELQRRLAAQGVTTIAVAAHPGSSHTDLGTEGSGVTNRVTTLLYPIFSQSVAKGALPMLRAVTDPDVVGGDFYGPRFVVAGWPVRERPSRRARNADDARRLWEISAELTHLA
ncbi:NAD(P)-dependent dehydrogenase (short-subunit alcohol dehydrogenase family) [Jatrophihabitans sp. GAS493]|uniref:oxidoreductase n=1 Tax=Jatrophihabitans sp. GAS493 TaxID=1907575 RepID=UPI000BB6DF53|nr:oxidoreductase [Jatrophihabitans sp. GAS493]SOD74224.1 NAD(P)-dependent dehydrogenase (short-subunit alcohol dehydrogenase family) [Jatrophihabitans sp. GAS493]